MPFAKLPRPTQVRVRALTTSAPRLGSLSATAKSKAEKISQEWKGTSATGGNTKNFIGGEFVESKAEKWIDVYDPVCYDAAGPKNFLMFGMLGNTNRSHQSPGDDFI